MSFDIIPPPATLEIRPSVQTAGIGSYCWREGNHGLCMDMIGIPTSSDPLPATIPLTTQLRLPLAEPPT
ncbi:MAG: hypothetical protein MI924_15515, partial [Chloroflexales bacterium]|nr:hypothetical protein [Chloroflexales bacterium]